MACHYCNQKRKKSRMRDMNNAVQEGMSANTAVGYYFRAARNTDGNATASSSSICS